MCNNRARAHASSCALKLLIAVHRDLFANFAVCNLRVARSAKKFHHALPRAIRSSLCIYAKVHLCYNDIADRSVQFICRKTATGGKIYRALAFHRFLQSARGNIKKGAVSNLKCALAGGEERMSGGYCFLQQINLGSDCAPATL